MTTASEYTLADTATPHRPRVLVVDDDAVVCMLVEDICTEAGWTVVIASNRADALLAAGLQYTDLVLLDFNLGDGKTLALIGELRTVSPSTPILVVTGQSPDEVRATVTKAGARDVVGKPCSVAQVVAVLRRFEPSRVSAGSAR